MKKTSAQYLNKQSGNEIAGMTLYDSQIKQTETMRQRIRIKKAIRDGGMLLLSQYRPKEFGNNKIDLTVDGG